MFRLKLESVVFCCQKTKQNSALWMKHFCNYEALSSIKNVNLYAIINPNFVPFGTTRDLIFDINLVSITCIQFV